MKLYKTERICTAEARLVPPPRAVGYVRVSTEEQVRGGVSLDAQEERVRAYCTMSGLELVSTIREEGISGGKHLDIRPGGKQLVSLVAWKKVEHVVALKLDRIFRDAEDALRQTKAWDKAGVALHLVDMGGQTLQTSCQGIESWLSAAGVVVIDGRGDIQVLRIQYFTKVLRWRVMNHVRWVSA
jgi:hypothetical protein